MLNLRIVLLSKSGQSEDSSLSDVLFLLPSKSEVLAPVRRRETKFVQAILYKYLAVRPAWRIQKGLLDFFTVHRMYYLLPLPPRISYLNIVNHGCYGCTRGEFNINTTWHLISILHGIRC
jgi:hypothetical protein